MATKDPGRQYMLGDLKTAFSQLSDDEVKKVFREEMEKRINAKYIEEMEKREQHAQRVVQSAGALLNLVAHDRTSCSDEDWCNIGRCTRCTLLGAQREGWLDTDYVITVEVTKQPIQKSPLVI